MEKNWGSVRPCQADRATPHLHPQPSMSRRTSTTTSTQHLFSACQAPTIAVCAPHILTIHYMDSFNCPNSPTRQVILLSFFKQCKTEATRGEEHWQQRDLTRSSASQLLTPCFQGLHYVHLPLWSSGPDLSADDSISAASDACPQLLPRSQKTYSTFTWVRSSLPGLALPGPSMRATLPFCHQDGRPYTLPGSGPPAPHQQGPLFLHSFKFQGQVPWGQKGTGTPSLRLGV